MGKHEEIRESLAAHAKRYGPMQTIIAEVQSVDEPNYICTMVDEDELIYENVRLRPVLDGNQSTTIFPKVGTWVLAIRIEEEEQWMVIAAGEGARYRIKIGTCTLETDGEHWSITKGNDSLKDVMKLTIEAVQKVIVLQGRNPDMIKLATALTKLNNIMI